MWYADDHVARVITDRRRCLFVQQMGDPVPHSSRPHRTGSGPSVWLSRQGGCLLAGVGRQLVTLGSRLQRFGAPQPSLR